MARKKTAPTPPLTIQMKIEGQIYTGSYTLEQGLVTVWYGQGKKTTQLGGSTLESLAGILLGELVGEEQAQGPF